MININTLDKLEKLHIGSDIDKLENYVALVNYSELMGNCIVSEDKKEKLTELLMEIKKNSDLFKYTWDMDKEDIDEFDNLYLKYGKFSGIKINDAYDKNTAHFANKLGAGKDIFAIGLPDGIDIRILYRKGIYYRAYTYHKGNKGRDITDHIKHLVPYNLQSITSTHLIELQSRITMTDEQMRSAGISEIDKLYFIVNYLSNEFCMNDIDKFTVISYKMYCEDPDYTTCNIWNEYDIFDLDDVRITKADNGLVREITSDTLSEAILKFEEGFNTLEDKEYLITDIILCILGEEYDTKLHLSKKLSSNYIYKSKIKDIKWVCGEYSQQPKIEIKPVITKQGNTVTSILLDNMNMLIKLSLSKGSDINFYINYADQIEVCDSHGNIII